MAPPRPFLVDQMEIGGRAPNADVVTAVSRERFLALLEAALRRAD